MVWFRKGFSKDGVLEIRFYFLVIEEEIEVKGEEGNLFKVLR